MGVDVMPVMAPFKYSQPRAGALTTTIEGAAAACEAAPTRTLPALYQSTVPSMDEGWTRWALDSPMSGYRVLHDSDLRTAAATKTSLDRIHTIILPDQPPNTILNGYKAGVMPPEYTGGLGTAGVIARRALP
jgi:hypothetical protein